jgi:hypothetical protein
MSGRGREGEGTGWNISEGRVARLHGRRPSSSRDRASLFLPASSRNLASPRPAAGAASTQAARTPCTEDACLGDRRRALAARSTPCIHRD